MISKALKWCVSKVSPAVNLSLATANRNASKRSIKAQSAEKSRLGLRREMRFLSLSHSVMRALYGVVS